MIGIYMSWFHADAMFYIYTTGPDQPIDNGDGDGDGDGDNSDGWCVAGGIFF